MMQQYDMDVEKSVYLRVEADSSNTSSHILYTV